VLKISKYRKKPVVIEAIQYHYNENSAKLESFIDDESLGYGEFQYFIETLEGAMKINDGDYIIKGVNGEFYPCKPDIFHKTYEKCD